MAEETDSKEEEQMKPIIESPDATIAYGALHSKFEYKTTQIERRAGKRPIVRPVTTTYEFETQLETPKLGVLLVGLGGNNGSTLMASVLANQRKAKWMTKDGERKANYFGSVTQASTVLLGHDNEGKPLYSSLDDLVPMAKPNDIVWHGWDINSANMAASCRRAKVLDYNLQQQLEKDLAQVTPMKSIYYPDFIAANQNDRADHILEGEKACQEHLDHLRGDIRAFREKHGLDKVIVLWTANTERYCEIDPKVHNSADDWLAAVKRGDCDEIPPSQIFAAAAILEGCSYINGSPQNTFVKAIQELAEREGVFIAGDDFKSGQTKFKSVMADFLISSGIKVDSIVSYNHLGNNDGKNLSSARQFRSKEISKANVVDDMVASNHLLYKPNEKPDHCVVIKYVPRVGDSKRAMDEYISEIFMGGVSQYALHNTCEDSLLAVPLIVDLVVLTELMERVRYRTSPSAKYSKMGTVLTILAFFLKAPLTPEKTPLINAFFSQKANIGNVIRALAGLPPINHMNLEFCMPKTA